MEIVVPDAMLAAWPPEAQAAVRLLLNHVAALEAEVAELKARLAKDSTNSSRPPSTMHPHAKPSKQSIRKAKRRGGQPGQPAYDELAARLPAEPVLNIDESPTKEASARAWVWTVGAGAFTVFACRTSRAGDVVKELLGEAYGGVVHCDRARMYWQFGRLQWCWAHLKRDFQAWIDSPCPTKRRLGRDLMRPTLELFALWKRVRDGTLDRHQFLIDVRPIRQEIDALLLRGHFNALTASVCRELRERRAHLWTFLEVEGVEPTNNAAERALRHAVIWRKLSVGTQSAGGSRFVERMLTVIETTRRQGTNAFEWLTEAVQAKLNGQAGPKLLAGA